MAKTKVKVVKKKSKIKGYLNSYSFGGIIGGVLLMAFGFGPSLLPRGWVMQALISGVLFSIGYGLGALTSHIVRMFNDKEPSKKNKAKYKNYTYMALAVIYTIALTLGYIWQKDSYSLIGLPQDPSYSIFGITILTVLVIMFIIWISRVIRTVFRWLKRHISKVLPPALSYALGYALTVLLVIGIVNGFILNVTMDALNQAFSVKNDTTPADIQRQNNPAYSGSDESLITWDSLGLQGRKFIGKVVTKEALRNFSNETPGQSVRIYSGLESADSAKARADLAVADLKRAGGFDKDVLVVVTTTGTGWVDEAGVDPIEYMYNGDSAIVAMQYSYLPSWISFLVDKNKAKEAGIELYNAIHDEWVKMPESDRPQLVSFGESLGSFGSEAAFPTKAALRGTSQGALWVGPPYSNAIWGQLTPGRDKGSPMILPVIDKGKTFRFAAKPEDFSKPTGQWTNPKAVYLQNASDPIVWWNPSIIYSKPDWYNETRGSDVNVATRWFPFVTFLQISADMAFSTGVPDGHGHRYGTLQVDGWSHVAPPDGWSTDKTQALKQHLTN